MKRHLCECGCGTALPTARYPSWQRRFVRGHNQVKKDRYREEDHGYRTPCWIWLLATDKAGYGTTKYDGTDMGAHRASYVEVYGPIPDGLHIDHLCRVPACVNPDHLEAVTPTENTRRSRATKLSRGQVKAIKTSSDSNLAVAIRYGVDPSNISHIRRGFSWREVA